MKKWYLQIFFLFTIIVLSYFVWTYFFRSEKTIKELDAPVVTVINPVRGPQLGLESVDILASLQSQYSVTAKEGIPATWLFQYSALEDAAITKFAKEQMIGQEFGIFLEVDRNTAAKSGVLYRGHGPWYFSDGLFLNAYDVGERKKIIDTVFAEFKKTFGYYPKTVGAWWVGADSLSYMHARYGVIASLQVADQYALDVYTVWGTPWSIPYLASQDNAAVPAQGYDKSSGVVIMQWAPRDPTYGYGNSPDNSIFSMQDYFLKNYDHSYIDYLLRVFLHKPGDQVVVGLETGAPPEHYRQDYLQRLERIKTLQQKDHFVFASAGDFAEGFLAKKSVFGTSYLLSTAYDSQEQSFWYHSSNYRAGIRKQGNDIFLIDVRDYAQAIPEEFIQLPNTQGHLRIVPKAEIDSAHLPQKKILLATSEEPLQVKEKNGNVILLSGDREIAFFTDNALNLLTKQKQFLFVSPPIFYNIFTLLVIILIVYLAVLWIKKKKKNIFVHGLVLLICLLIAKPYLFSGTVSSGTFVFDQKQLFIATILPFMASLISWQTILFFQVLPFVLLLLSHTFFVVQRSRIKEYMIIVFFYIFFYAHIPVWIITDFITRKTILSAAVLGAFGCISICLLIYIFMKKRFNLLKTTIVYLFFSGLLLLSIVFLSWQKYVITPFETEAFRVVSIMKKNILIVTPKREPVYRAVAPLLLKDYKFGEQITSVSWNAITRPEGGFLEISDTESVIFVPEYLGAELYPEEKTKYHLKKIFDNGQISLYRR